MRQRGQLMMPLPVQQHVLLDRRLQPLTWSVMLRMPANTRSRPSGLPQILTTPIKQSKGNAIGNIDTFRYIFDW
jgi:hypothetical protein